MIRVFLGNLGSGKTASAVREMFLNRTGRVTYTNIVTQGIPYVKHIRPEHVIKKIEQDKKKPKLELNIAYWQKQPKPLNVVWDEIHLTASSRSSMSPVNKVLSRFLAMARRITGFDERGYGTFTFVAQKERTVDVNIRELTNEIHYHISHWILYCEECRRRVLVNSELQQISKCLICGSWKLIKTDLRIEIIKFNDWNKFFRWSNGARGMYYGRELITDIGNYYPLYDTLQLSDMWGEYITE